MRPVRLLAEEARAARLNDSLRAIDAALRRLTPDAECVYTRASGLPRLSRQRPRPVRIGSWDMGEAKRRG